jgi:hypothetical protein
LIPAKLVLVAKEFSQVEPEVPDGKRCLLFDSAKSSLFNNLLILSSQQQIGIGFPSFPLLFIVLLDNYIQLAGEFFRVAAILKSLMERRD